MAQLIVGNLEEDLEARLKRRAECHGRSMEEEARHILRNALRQANQAGPRLGSRIAARFAKVGLTADLPKLHGGRSGRSVAGNRRVR
jgi:antitoxin FitA